ncbi:MAG: hypothetical protein D6718_08340, partial [Acidobacteria bacterium]
MRSGVRALFGLALFTALAAGACHVFDESDPLTGAEAQGAAGPAELGIYLSSFETDPSGFDP